mmetsp:Transcript_56850/g.114143  ORF Transcript_56850/g.114143 Transcript_56850/m.114143 type:complete len:210 (+) Transcript_56850:593-1222(+)
MQPLQEAHGGAHAAEAALALPAGEALVDLLEERACKPVLEPKTGIDCFDPRLQLVLWQGADVGHVLQQLRLHLDEAGEDFVAALECAFLALPLLCLSVSHEDALAAVWAFQGTAHIRGHAPVASAWLGEDALVDERLVPHVRALPPAVNILQRPDADPRLRRNLRPRDDHRHVGLRAVLARDGRPAMVEHLRRHPHVRHQPTARHQTPP